MVISLVAFLVLGIILIFCCICKSEDDSWKRQLEKTNNLREYAAEIKRKRLEFEEKRKIEKEKESEEYRKRIKKSLGRAKKRRRR